MGFGAPARASVLWCWIDMRGVISRGIALGRSRQPYEESSPLRGSRRGIRLEASGSEDPEGKRWGASARVAARRLA
jgi:hypothetical protein